MREIDAGTLGDYREDRQALRRFERPYLVPCLMGVAIFLIGFVLLWRTGDLRFVVLCPTGIAVFLVAIYVMYRATPLSSYTGRPMEKYRNIAADAACLEIFYVCPESKTFFKRVFMTGRSTAPL